MADIVRLNDDRLRSVFSYPRFSGIHYSKVLSDLEAIGVEGISSEGRLEIGEILVLGKGCVGIVLLGSARGKEMALKVLRSDANRRSLKVEGGYLAIANGCGVGPKLVQCTESVLAMEYIRGKYLRKWLEEPHTREEIRHVLGELLKQCYALDKAGLDHGELSNAKKHILVDSTGNPHILDFETASTKRRCRNFVAMLSYLFFKDTISLQLKQIFRFEKEPLMDAIREYKELPSQAVFERILAQLGWKT
jgi:putative serine/threonine protein kinase